jgi:hypothetical protein
LKLVVKPDTFAERMALRLNWAPTPLIETQLALVSARAIMAATELGVFSCLGERLAVASKLRSGASWIHGLLRRCWVRWYPATTGDIAGNASN